MSYSLNNIPLSNYGLEAGQAPGSNVALVGMFDLPSRLGQTHQTWAEGEIEPFVDADEIFLGGRDLIFHGFVIGYRDQILTQITSLKSDINAFTDLVVFSTAFGDFNVKIDRIESEILNGVGRVVIRMREPIVDLSGGVLPTTGAGNYLADRIPLKSFGMYVSKVTGRGDLKDMDKESFTVYDREGYQVTGRKPNEINIRGFVEASDLATFQARIKALWKLFTDPGTRKVRLNDYVTIESFVTDGFSVSNFIKQNGLLIANIDLKIIAVSEYITVYLTANANGKILTTEDGKILVF